MFDSVDIACDSWFLNVGSAIRAGLEFFRIGKIDVVKERGTTSRLTLQKSDSRKITVDMAWKLAIFVVVRLNS